MRLPAEPDGLTPRGFGFVQFRDVESASYARALLSGVCLHGRPLRLAFSPSGNTERE